MPEWIRPAGCESGSCVEYRTVGDKVFVRNSNHDVMIRFSVAEWDTFVAGLQASAPCSCQSWPPDGPSPDCAVHGAIRALNETMVERDQLAAENARLRQDLAEEKATTKRALDSYERMGKAASRYSAEHEEAEGELRTVIAELLVLRHRDRRTQAVVDAAVGFQAAHKEWLVRDRRTHAPLVEAECSLLLAVDAYEKGPTEPPESPLPAEQAPVAAEEATDGLEAQGGARQGAEVPWTSPVHTTSPDEADGWQAIHGFVNRLRRDVELMQVTFLGAVPALTEVLPEPAAPTAADLQAARDQTRADAETMLADLSFGAPKRFGKRFWLWSGDIWIEVDKAEYVACERAAGFNSTTGRPNEPATASFRNGQLRGTTLNPDQPAAKSDGEVPEVGLAEGIQVALDGLHAQEKRRADLADREAGRAGEAQTITETPEASSAQQVIKRELWARLDEVMSPAGSMHETELSTTTLGDWLGDRVYAALIDAGLEPVAAEPQDRTEGLDAAIEAAVAANLDHAVHERGEGWVCACGVRGSDRPLPNSKAHRHLVMAEVFAASPLIASAALHAAADDWENDPFPDIADEVKWIYVEALRDRATRTETS